MGLNWQEGFPLDDMPAGIAVVRISDGGTVYCAASDDLDAAIADFSAEYCFNEPGVVVCHASFYPADWDGEAVPSVTRRFEIAAE